MSDRTEILLINRDKEFLENIGAQLRHAGYCVHGAMDMRESLTAITSHPIGLIVCDHALQDVSGYDFLHYLKSDPLRDSIPFVFFVPLNDQGRAFKAFEMGAMDFWVYPLEAEDLVKRVGEIIPLMTSGSTDLPPQPSQEVGPAPRGTVESKVELDRRVSDRVRIAPFIQVEVSRDNILWLPAQLMNFSRDGIFLRTALLGKHGLSLKVKFGLPAGFTIVPGEIRHIAFNDFHQPAGIGIKMEQGQDWGLIHRHLLSLMNSEPRSELETNVVPAVQPLTAAAKTVMIGNQQGEGHAQESEEESFDIRFYHSLIGKQLDNYKAVSFLGAGTMGGVFKGWDIALEREVAIKVISYKLASQETFRDMFIKEARTISKLDHPNIAHIYYIGDTDNILYFVMEFITGQTLKNLIDQRVNLNTLRGLEYLITTCQALDFVSNKNIIHRDIKPENLMIDGKGSLKIVDFGVAKTIEADKPVKQEGIVGSPLYMSPDCIAGGPLDHRSDIYSLGASFYHAFTGFPPFNGNDAEEVLLKHLNDPCIPLNERNPKVSRSLGAIIEKMMAKEPAQRYQDYGMIVKDLRALRTKALRFQQLKNSTLIIKAGSIAKMGR
ncbi:MAG: response regulator [Desulfobacteraceae bacterium]|nr:MAG: response regulator [Desulfobacteraceae bacterium]